MAGQEGDHGVARRGVERHRAQQCAGTEPPDETRAMELVVSPGDRDGVFDPFGEGLADDFRHKLRAAKRQQNAAAGEWIDESSGVADGNHAIGGIWLSPAEAFPRCA